MRTKEVTMTSNIPKILLSALCLLALPVAKPTADLTAETTGIQPTDESGDGTLCEEPTIDPETNTDRAIGSEQSVSAVECKKVCCERVCEEECCGKECSRSCKVCHKECDCC